MSFVEHVLSWVPLVLAPLAGYLVYRWQAREQVSAAKAQADIQAAQSPIQVLTAAVTARDQELAAIRESHERFMQERVTELQAITTRLTDTLSGIEASCQAHCQTLREVHGTLVKHAEDATKGRGILHARINNLQLMMAGVKILPPEEPPTT
jgi:predicted RNA-binding Zn ribbon-like protein